MIAIAYAPTEWALAASTLLAALGSFITAIAALRKGRHNAVTLDHQTEKLHAIDKAVNGVPPGEPTIAENVAALVEHAELPPST